MKIRAESLSFAEIIPIKNQAIIKRFEQRINMIEECYYSGDDIEICRVVLCIDQFRHPYYPDDIEAILTKTGLQAEKIWVRLTKHLGEQENAAAFSGILLNTPYNESFNLYEGDEVIIAVVNDEDTLFRLRLTTDALVFD